MVFLQEAKDCGGLRKYLITDVLNKIGDKYILNDVKHYLKDDPYNVGTILGEVTSEELTLVKPI